MRLSTLLGALLSITLPFVAANPRNAHGNSLGRRHDEVARRARGDLARRQATVNGPYANSRFTFYAVGLGSCGITNVESDYIVALNSAQYGGGYPGPNCFLSITIQVGSITATATITDECPGCPSGGLDMSQGLFEHFADTSVGVLTGTWWVNGAGSNPTTSSPPAYTPTTPAWTPEPSPTTSDTPVWTPSTTWSPPPPPSSTTPVWTPPSSSYTPWSSSVSTPSSSSVWTPSSSTTPSSSSAPSSSWTPSSSEAWIASSSSVAPAVETPTSPDTLEAVNQVVVGMAALMVAGAQQHQQ
ncbi:hypothetical protein BKA93DRAFT_760932 [Sparassis latifolia]|uniref:Allergen Asp f 7 n=1 Tax=Sparassis crispa TaxID=139825 RepID=A0A401GJW3_9APHY|nr:Allergen Asp f 7 [Sparassis crispa]GBE82443.1 Allergen Asp f 7 [Sparassis crispa]